MDNKICMLRHCTSCPNSEQLKKFLEEKFEACNPTDEIQYQQWVSTDPIEMMTCTITLDEYIATSIKSLRKLIPHFFITKDSISLSKRKLKQNLLCMKLLFY